MESHIAAVLAMKLKIYSYNNVTKKTLRSILRCTNFTSRDLEQKLANKMKNQQ